MMHTILEEGLQDEEYIRETTDDFEAVREIVMRYPPEEAEKVTGVPAEDIRATAREYASERHAAIFYTLGITEHACGVDNIWSLSNLVLMTGHLGYESTGLNALRGQNNVQGLNDSGREPVVPPRLPAGRRPRDPAEVRRGVGRRGPERPGYRLDQIVSGLHDGRIKALYLIGENPAQTEPNAHHVEEGLEGLDFLMSQDIFLNDSTRKYADVVLPASSFAEKDGTFTNTERRISRVRAAAPLPGEAKGRPRDRHPHGEGARRELARSTRTRSRSGTSSPTSRRTGTASATTGSRRTACSGRAPTSTIRARRTCTHRGRRCRAVAGASSRSSSSRRSRSRTPSTRSCSRPAGRSTTTTRRT